MRNAVAFLVLAALVGVLGLGARPIDAGGTNFHCNQVNLHPGSLQNGQETVPYSDVLWLTPANPALQVTVLSVVGALPPGLSFTPGPNINQVTLSGTPPASSAGTYTFTVVIGGTYVLGTICTVTATYTITITP